MNEADYSEKQLTLFEVCEKPQTESTQSGSCGKMSQEHLAQIKGMTLELCWKKSQKPTFQCLILDDGARGGLVRSPKCNVAWRTLDAQYWGVPQRRARIFLIAGFGADSRPEVLFEPESLLRNTEESQDERKGTAGNTAQSTDTTSWAFEPGITSRDGRKLTENKSTTLRADMGDNQTAVLTPWDVQTCNQGGIAVIETKTIGIATQSYYDMQISDKGATLRAAGGAYGGGSENYAMQISER